MASSFCWVWPQKSAAADSDWLAWDAQAQLWPPCNSSLILIQAWVIEAPAQFKHDSEVHLKFFIERINLSNVITA